MVDLKKLRPDWVVGKWLAENVTLDMARAWMHQPFVDLRECVIPWATTDEPVRDNLRMSLFPPHVLFESAVYCVDWTLEDDNRLLGAALVGFTPGYTHGVSAIFSPAYVLAAHCWHAAQEGSQLRLVFEKKYFSFPPEGGSLSAIDASSVDTAAWAFNFLDETILAPVEVRPEPSGPPTPRQLRTARNKPWLCEDLPRIILMDPRSRVPRKEGTPQGTHASPVPHQRRGNFALLKSARFKHKQGQRVFRKPTWVGDKEWTQYGKVLAPGHGFNSERSQRAENGGRP
jgi:hypothetical protein